MTTPQPPLVAEPTPDDRSAADMVTGPTPGTSPGIRLDQLDLSEFTESAKPAAKSSKQQLREAVAAVFRTAEVAFNQFDEPYIILRQGAAVRLIPLESQDAVDWLRLQVHRQRIETLSEDAAKAELGLIRAQAKEVRRQIRMYKRTAKLDAAQAAALGIDPATLFIDLGTPTGEVVVISGGHWSVQPNPGVFFCRGPGYGEHPLPVSAGGPLAALKVMVDWGVASGLNEKAAKVQTAMIAYAMIPGLPKPIIEFIGPPGASKSTKTQQAVQLIDPTTTQFAPEVPIKDEHIAAAARVHIVLVADNQNSLSGAQSDLLCRSCSGTSISFRKLYFQGAMHTTEVQVTIILNGVNSVLLRADLRNRACTFRLPARTKFQTAEEVEREFTQQRPQLLGALFDLLAAGLNTMPQVPAIDLQLRLADLARFGEAMLIACGEPAGTFVDLLHSFQRSSSQDMLTEDPFTSKVLDVLRDCTKPPLTIRSHEPPVREWIKGSGTKGWTAYQTPDGRTVVCIGSSQLLSRIRNSVLYRDEGWVPKSELQLNNALYQASPAFRDIGIDATQEKFDNKTTWRFTWMPPVLGLDPSEEP